MARVDIDPDVLDSLHQLIKLRVEDGVKIHGKRAVITFSSDLGSIAAIIGDVFEEFGFEIGVFDEEPGALDWLMS